MIEWRVKKFADLSVQELYDFLQQRVDIFIVDMNTPYSDLDGKDNHSETYHVMGYENERLVAYSRIMAQKLGYPVGVLPLLDSDATREVYPDCSIFISAQAHLKDYYGKFGFDVVTDSYLEDGCSMLGLRYTPQLVAV
ncbi:GNAT family N-acetyltransferase [Vibrio lentus]|uniref:GNAT family N-acetyltransferase n=1 Tax=Vibrio lentus TaxID=136468 RepID=A0A2N7K1I5_9VIBR|nr:GNAT family N-acetyltransferase [Vibrio lentus]PMM67235.1 GNAT family N-acetyltransferase [Vibrio lentus]